jgi:hypothetical protein
MGAVPENNLLSDFQKMTMPTGCQSSKQRLE